MGDAILALVGTIHFSAQGMSENLHAITNAKHGHIEIEDPLVGHGRTLGVNRCGAAAENNAGRIVFLNLINRCVVRKDEAEHIRLTHTARDELTILRAEVEDDDGLVLGFVHVLVDFDVDFLESEEEEDFVSDFDVSDFDSDFDSLLPEDSPPVLEGLPFPAFL